MQLISDERAREINPLFGLGRGPLPVAVCGNLKCQRRFEPLRTNQIYCCLGCTRAAKWTRRMGRPGPKKALKESRKRSRIKRLTKNQEFILNYKLSHPCPCGEANPVCLIFHHRDPSVKSFTIAHVNHHKVVLEVLIAEIAKCDVMCFNCHAKYHAAHPELKNIVRPDGKRKSAFKRKYKLVREIAA